ncbi:hypothetical protein I4U23_006971 [Adineta vaga]|nr:hypothetical protein I4U23_006971 [Adineta vaga]
MMRKFRRIFRTPSSTATPIKNETMQKTNSCDSTLDDASYVKKRSSPVINCLNSTVTKRTIGDMFVYITYDCIRTFSQNTRTRIVTVIWLRYDDRGNDDGDVRY